MSIAASIALVALLASPEETLAAYEACMSQSTQACKTATDLVGTCKEARTKLRAAVIGNSGWSDELRNVEAVLDFLGDQSVCDDVAVCEEELSCERAPAAEDRCEAAIKTLEKIPRKGEPRALEASRENLKRWKKTNEECEQAATSGGSSATDGDDDGPVDDSGGNKEGLSATKRIAFAFGTSGVGAVVAIAGAVMMARASHVYQDVPERRLESWVRPTYWTGVTFVSLGGLAAIIGAAVGTKLVLERRRPRNISVAPMAQPGSAGVVVQWRLP